MKQRRALMIEDDPKIAEVLRANIAELDLELDWVSDGAQGFARAQSGEYAILILDLMLPSMNGLEICRQLREQAFRTPILMLTAKSDEVEKVIGLEVGADDYLTKPFNVPELLARMRALLRRSRWESALGSHSEAVSNERTIIRKGDLEIDLNLHRATLRGEQLKLSVMEFDILAFLAQNPGKPFTRAALLQEIWGTDLESYETNVNSSISRLRKKIEVDLNNPRYIKTVWGLGYRFAQDDEL